jgi:hypothetical protein
MALAFSFSPTPVMTAQQYDECIKRLQKAGAGHPRGRVYHACFGTRESVAVFDVWTSQADFEKFGETLTPILHQLGVDAGQPRVMEIHNVIIPPAARQRPELKKRASAKRAAQKKSTARRRASRKQ